jgi:PAS domain S-box-containing protein
MIPFARVPLPEIWAFIPIYESALVISDLITAILLLAQHDLLRSRSLLVLGCGYLFTAAMIVSHALTFPGLFMPTGLFGAGPQSTAWLYMFWHAGFPLVVIAYALLKRIEDETGATRASNRTAIASGVAVVLAAACALTLIATVGHDALPVIMANNRYTSVMMFVNTTVWLLSPAALVVLWVRRPHSLLDLWLMVVMFVWFFDVGLSAVLNAGRFDLGFYVGRIYGLLAATFVLLMLLLDTAALYAQLVYLLGAEEQERLRVADRHRRLFETSLELILVTDRRGRFIEVSPSSASILGYRPEEMTGRTGIEFLHPDDVETTRSEMRQARRGRLMRNFETRYVHKDGQFVTLAWSGVWSEIEQLHFFIGRDVTEAKRTERLKNEFVATVSHELRTPLTAIAGSLGLLTGRGAERLADPRRLLTIAQANSQRLLSLVNDILDIERIEGDRMVFDFQQVEVKPLIEGAIEAARVFAETFYVAVRLDDRADDVAIYTDANRLTQVIANLLSNAVKFSPRDQEVVVTIEATDDRISIAVRDHGPGIPDEFKARVFEKFVQVDASDARLGRCRPRPQYREAANDPARRRREPRRSTMWRHYLPHRLATRGREGCGRGRRAPSRAALVTLRATARIFGTMAALLCCNARCRGRAGTVSRTRRSAGTRRRYRNSGVWRTGRAGRTSRDCDDSYRVCC